MRCTDPAYERKLQDVNKATPALRCELAKLALKTSADVENARGRIDFGDAVSQKWIGQYEHVRLGASHIVSEVFRRLQVDHYLLSDFVASQEPVFIEHLRDAQEAGETDNYGHTVVNDALLRDAFVAVESEFRALPNKDFNEILDQAQKFGFWLVDEAVRAN